MSSIAEGLIIFKVRKLWLHIASLVLQGQLFDITDLGTSLQL